MVQFKGTQEDLSMILVSAVRYALRRRTCIVAWIADVVADNINNLIKEDREEMLRNIKLGITLKDECDKYDWQRLLAILEEKVDGDI